ncbi:hypothetical protein [uncultured Muribaculum sp.]|uniref:hypothetical protein n=1 Tax=uncultured Muribaculum sp. TaxID=1918613 RepID=UPI00272FC41C|nr:hypothetical protein [uncultured Muribaculum sp.]
MKLIHYILASIIIPLGAISCKKNQTIDIAGTDVVQEISFFGDSTLTIISSNQPNGYKVKIFQSKDLILLNLTRGDSINQYIPLHMIPQSLVYDSDIRDLIGDGVSVGDSIGTFVREINIKVEKEELGRGLFFMDVNFDGEEELLVEYSGYNRIYFACFDIVNGISNVTPGILHAMNDEPYNNIVSTDYHSDIVGEINTYFDYNKKTIHIFEQMGCCSHVETWCELIADYEWEMPAVKVVRREEIDYTADGRQLTRVHKRVDGKLVLIEEKEEPM